MSKYSHLPAKMPTRIHMPEGISIETSGDAKCSLCMKRTVLTKKTLTKEAVESLLFGASKLSRTFTTKEIARHFDEVKYSTHTRLKYWGLIEKVGGAKYYVTERGMAFVRGIFRLPEHMFIYNDMPRIVPEEWHGRYLSIHELVAYKEMSRDIAAAESVPLSATPQQKLV